MKTDVIYPETLINPNVVMKGSIFRDERRTGVIYPQSLKAGIEVGLPFLHNL